MWRSGVARRRCHTAIAVMTETAVRTGRFDAPWRATPEVWEHFRDEGDILRHLHREWRTSLAGAVYVAIESGQGDLHQDVVQAFRRTQRRQSGTRRILEHYADHPAIAAAMRKERALLSSFVGLLADEVHAA